MLGRAGQSQTIHFIGPGTIPRLPKNVSGFLWIFLGSDTFTKSESHVELQSCFLSLPHFFRSILCFRLPVKNCSLKLQTLFSNQFRGEHFALFALSY